jgi:hypothetical protein
VGTMRGNQSIVELSPQAPAVFADIKDGRLG